ncbi:MAG: hypothetical protein PHT33_13435, partial [bacterium]|nr:hypothetical protein [bacterium]
MEQMPRYAVIADLIRRLYDYGSWCGETHIQKTMCFLQELLDVPTGFEFILYKHGPFSFDLRDELSAMHAYQMVEFAPQPLPYGPRWHVTESGDGLQGNFPVTLGKYETQLRFVVAKLGDKRVGELEKLATALYVTKRYSKENDR